MSTFVGREEELAAIDARFADGALLVTVVGPPGVGKTRLARRWLSKRVGAFVNLAPCHSTSELLLAVSTAIGVRTPLEDAEEIGRVLATMAPYALVLDNAEHLLEETASLVTRSSIPVLVTSRQPLRLESEVRLPLAPLPEATAVRLFLDRAQTVAPDLSADDDTIAAIVRRLDRLPLAIELAAARCGVLAPAEVLSRLDERFSLLAQGGRSLEAAIEWSWNLLDPWEQTALAQCTVFAGGFTVAAAERVIVLDSPAPPVLDVLQGLHDRSLVFARRSGNMRRLELYESVREFARRRAGDLSRAELRHAEYCVEIAGSEPLHHDLLLVVERMPPPLAARAALAVLPTLLDRGPIHEALRLAMHAAELAETIGTPELRAEAELAVAESQRRCGLLREALEHLARARGFAAASALLDARARLAEAILRRDLCEYEEAFALADAAFECAEEHRDAALAARAQLIVATLYLQLQHEDAKTSCYDSLERARQSGNRIDQAIALTTCGFVEHDGGAYDVALQFYEEALSIARELDEPRVQAILLGSLATLHATRGELDRAQEHAREALAHSQRFGDRRLTGYAEATLALIAGLRGDIAESDRSLAAARAWLAPCGDTMFLEVVALCDAVPLLARAERSLAGGDMARARAHFARARVCMRAVLTPKTTEHDVQLPLANRCIDARFILRMLETRASAIGERLGEAPPSSSQSPKLQVAADGRWFQLRGQPRIAMAHRPILASVLTVLARARSDQPGTGVNPDDLFAAAWRGERAVRRARAARVYVAISSLRKLGLGDVLRRTHEGYLFDPAIAFQRAER